MLRRHFPSVSSTVVSMEWYLCVMKPSPATYIDSMGDCRQCNCGLHLELVYKYGNVTDFGTAASKGWALVRPYTCFTHPQEPLIHFCLLFSESLIFLIQWICSTAWLYSCLCVQNTVFHPSSFINASLLTFDFIPSQHCWRNWYKVFSLLSVAQRTGTIESKGLVCLSGAGCVFNTDTTSCTHSQYLVVKCSKLDDLCVYVNVLEAYCANTYM